jgi:hypothetical protein
MKAAAPDSRQAKHQVLYLDFDGVLHPDEVYWHPRRGAYLREDLVAAGHALICASS